MLDFCRILRRRRTITEWERYFGITVLDPDGFNRRDPHLRKRRFTEREFTKGVLWSTCIFPEGNRFLF